MTQNKPSFSEAFRFWLKLGFINFGGPSGQVALMHEELVEKRRWISEYQFLHALNYCMILPGPEAQQLSIYIGWLMHGIRGGIVAGVFFVLPSVFILGILSWLYVTYGNLPWVIALFAGLKPAVVALVAGAAARIGRKTLRSTSLWAISALSFSCLFVFQVPFPWVILGAILLGCLGSKWIPKQFALIVPAQDSGANPTIPASTTTQFLIGFRSHFCRVLVVGLLLWWGPVALLILSLGLNHSIVQEAIFFSKAALITFGGAYAVLPYVSQQAVENYHWLNASQMLDGLGLAETTPGPLIMVLQFVGFLGAYGQPGSLSPSLSGLLGALITTWTTFLPSFIFIFLGAPWVERLRNQPSLNAALSAVTAAVVGVILNLGVWFGWHVFYSTNQGVHWFSLVFSAVAYIALTHFKVNLLKVLAVSVIFGLVIHLCGWAI